MKTALATIANNVYEKGIVLAQAEGLHDRMFTLEVGLYTVFWHDILERVNATNKTLQIPTLDINTAVASLESLIIFVQSKREFLTIISEKTWRNQDQRSTCRGAFDSFRLRT